MYADGEWIYSPYPDVEERMIELNGDADYYAELRAASAPDPDMEASMDEWRDMEMFAEWEKQRNAGLVKFNEEDIPF